MSLSCKSCSSAKGDCQSQCMRERLEMSHQIGVEDTDENRQQDGFTLVFNFLYAKLFIVQVEEYIT